MNATLPPITAVDDPSPPVLVVDAGAITFREAEIHDDEFGGFSCSPFPEVTRVGEQLGAVDVADGTFNIVWIRHDDALPTSALLDVIRHRADQVIVQRFTPAWDHAQRASGMQNLLAVVQNRLTNATDLSFQGDWQACREQLVAAASTLIAEIDRVDVAVANVAAALGAMPERWLDRVDVTQLAHEVVAGTDATPAIAVTEQGVDRG